MNQSSEWLKIQILRKYIYGLSQEQIAIELDISEGTVSEFLQESRKLDNTLILQHEIAVICNKYNIPVQQLASNLAFSNALKKMAYDEEKIHLVLRVLNKILVEDGGFSPEKVASLILQICNFMEANGLSLEETHGKIEENRKELSEIKNNITESKKTIARIQQKKIEAFRKRRIRFADLRAFTVCKKAFSNAGIDFNNLKQISNVISVISKLDCNPGLIINEMKKTSALESRKFSLDKECDEREKNLQIYEEQEQIRANYNNSYNMAVDLVNQTLLKSVTTDDIVSIFNAIITHNFYLSISDLTKDINTYGGIKSAIFKRKRELEKLTHERDELIKSRETFNFV